MSPQPSTHGVLRLGTDPDPSLDHCPIQWAWGGLLGCVVVQKQACGEELAMAQKDGQAASVKSSQEHPYCSRRLHVVLGVTNPSSRTEQNVQVVDYEKMIYHPYFSITSMENNLLLIKLKRYIQLDDHVKLVGLPTEPAPEGAMCTVSTWAFSFCDVCEWLRPSSLRTGHASSPSLLLAPAILPHYFSQPLYSAFSSPLLFPVPHQGSPSRLPPTASFYHPCFPSAKKAFVLWS